MHKVNVCRSSHYFLYSASNQLQETPATPIDNSNTITSMERVNYEDVYSAISENAKKIETDDQLDHTYDTAKFDNHIDMLREQPQYNTLQHGNNGGITECGLRLDDAYDKIKVYTSKDANNCSNFIKQIPRISHRAYDYVEAKRDRVSQVVPKSYEQVYDAPNCMEVHKSTGKKLGFEAAVQYGVNRIKPTSHSETVKDETPETSKEGQYAEPMVPNDKSAIQDVKAEGEHFYHSLEQTNAKKGFSGHTTDEEGATNAPTPFNFDHREFDDPMYKGIPHMVPEQINSTLNKMHHDNAFPEEVSCIGDVNVHPDMLNLEEDTSTPGYSDPDCLDDTNISNGQKRYNI